MKHMKQTGPSRINRIVSGAYVCATLAVLAIPVVAIPWAPVDESAELQTLAEWPTLVTDEGGLNVEYLSEAGDWLDDHFAFRQQMITLDAKVQKDVFATSAVSQVIVGTDDWLYYASTLSDYERTIGFTDQTYRNMAKNLSLAKEYVESCGAEFIAVIAPDKSNVAGQNMPYYLLEGEGASVAELVTDVLAQNNVTTTSLLDRLEGHPEWFFKTDSHWNTQGALQVYYALMETAGIEPFDYSDANVTYNTEFVGDLEAMLYPLDRAPESEVVYDGSDDYEMAAGEDVSDSLIQTMSTNADSSGVLYMYRDSFANSLIPFFATQFSTATFSKYIPYDLTQISETGTTLVVVERAERHASLFASDPAIMPAPAREVPIGYESAPATAALNIVEDGGYYVVTGQIPGIPEGECSVYLGVGDECYEAGLVSTFDDDMTLLNDNGFKLYLQKGTVDSFDNAALYVLTSDGVVRYETSIAHE